MLANLVCKLNCTLKLLEYQKDTQSTAIEFFHTKIIHGWKDYMNYDWHLKTQWVIQGLEISINDRRYKWIINDPEFPTVGSKAWTPQMDENYQLSFERLKFW